MAGIGDALTRCGDDQRGCAAGNGDCGPPVSGGGQRWSGPSLFCWLGCGGRLWVQRLHTRWELPPPAVVVSFRASLCPRVLFIGQRWRNGTPLAVCIALALLSDVTDGVLARRWQIDTENLRRWDTRADTFFYACVFVVALLLFPGALARRWLLICGLITVEVL